MKAVSRKFWKALRLLRRGPWRRGLRLGVAAAIEHGPALRARDFATVVDIGANVGQFSLFCRGTFPAAVVFAFEPLPQAASRFRLLFAEDAKVTLFESAVGPAEGTATLHLSKRRDSSSLLPIGARQAQVFPGTEEDAQLEIAVAPLDRALSAERLAAPALLKLDVQGFELEALQGSESLLTHFDAIYVECSYVELYEGQALADRVIAFLADRGFDIEDRYNTVTHPDVGPVQSDILFTRPNSADPQ